jgi:hypothetical protein
MNNIPRYTQAYQNLNVPAGIKKKKQSTAILRRYLEIRVFFNEDLSADMTIGLGSNH